MSQFQKDSTKSKINLKDFKYSKSMRCIIEHPVQSSLTFRPGKLFLTCQSIHHVTNRECKTWLSTAADPTASQTRRNSYQATQLISPSSQSPPVVKIVIGLEKGSIIEYCKDKRRGLWLDWRFVYASFERIGGLPKYLPNQSGVCWGEVSWLWRASMEWGGLFPISGLG